MPIEDYRDNWQEEAPRVWAEENDFDSPMADMTDDEIKQAVYDRMRDDFEFGAEDE
jgi:hypothetical protein